VALVALAACAGLSGCGSAQTPAAAMRGWASASSFDQAYLTLVRDAGHVAVAIERHTSAVRTDCDELFVDANGENTDLLPTPDDQLTRLLSGAFDRFVQAAARCSSDPGSRATLLRADTELQSALFRLLAGRLREEQVAGQPIGVP
jgi:hypothetical protein